MAKFDSLKGQLLLDSGQLRGSFFHRSVVLVCQHDGDGAFGLVLTNPTENKVGDVLVADLPDSLKEDTLFIGGPVQTTALSYLHSDNYLADPCVIPNLQLGHSLDDLIELSGSFSPSKKIRCFAGYAGWTAGQLEGEMKRKAWLRHPATIEDIFSGNPDTLWKKILGQMSWEQRLLANSPDDLSAN